MLSYDRFILHNKILQMYLSLLVKRTTEVKQIQFQKHSDVAFIF